MQRWNSGENYFCKCLIYVWCMLQTELFPSRSIIKAQEEAVTQNSGDFTSLFVYPILIGSLLFNLAIGGKLLESGELLDLPNLSPLIDMAIDQLEQPLEQQDLGDISKIDRFQSKIDQDFSDFDFIDTSPPKQNKVKKGNPVLEGGGDEEAPLLQLTNLLTTKLLNNLGEDVVWPRIRTEEEDKEQMGNMLAFKADPIRILKKIRKEKEGIFGKKKHYVRRKHLTQMRDK